jgi:arylsulfatase
MWKRYGNLRGGTADPLIVSWPAGISARGGIRRQYCHAVDIVPTLYDALGIELPEVVNGYPQKPLEGVSFAASFDDPSADTGKETQFYSMLGTRALWHRGWKAASLGPAAPNAWGQFSSQRWELFHTDADPSECHDLAGQEPERLRELVDIWWVEAGKYQALPLETRNAVEALTTPRPELFEPRSRYTYLPGGAEVPESQAPNIRGRSYTLAAEVDIDSEDAGGVLFSQGSRFGGHALYVKDGRLVYVYNFVGETLQVVVSDQRIPAGHVVLSASFEREGDSMPPQGTLTLHIRDQQAGEGRIVTQPGKFGLGGGGLAVGRSGAEPVSDDYPGQRPWAFAGGTIKRVIIDVSGQPFVDLAREAAAVYARQ